MKDTMTPIDTAALQSLVEFMKSNGVQRLAIDGVELELRPRPVEWDIPVGPPAAQ